VLRRLGAGGMAEVFLAKSSGAEGIEKVLVVKRVLPTFARSPKFIGMFVDEAKVAMRLNHPNIVQVYAFEQVKDEFLLAMEFVDGLDLGRLVASARRKGLRLPYAVAAFVVMEIAKGLDYAHNRKDESGLPMEIVHRDVSPQTVLVSFDGAVKVADFGIARARMVSEETGIIKGKFSYMSPEQIRGMPLDQRTDVFSAGIILHEVLTTEKLFRGDTEFALMEKVRKAEVPPPSNFNRRVTPELDAIVQRALARDVADRYQSAAHLAADLDALIAGYRFDPKELRQFMRQLFRTEYAKEQEETQLALESQPLHTAGTSDAYAAFTTTDQARTTVPMNVVTPLPGAGPEAPSPPGAPLPAPEGDRPRGFWGALFKKRK